MRALRPFLWAAILVAVFLYVTSVGHWNVSRLLPSEAGSHTWAEPASAASGFSTDEQNNIDVYKAAREATVNITSVVYRENFFMQVYPSEGTGSGFILNADGEILTNNHVVKGSSQLTVTLADKKVFKAKIIGTDPRDDLALIRIEAGRKLPAMHLGDSDVLVVGQKVLAIGNPFGFEGTLTTGIVSSLNRTIQTSETSRALEGMIQTDAAINPGNSGGPLLDSHGNVIGINTAIYGPQGNIGIGFAMPINRAKSMLDEFQKHGRISRPYLGIKEVWVTGDLAEMLDLPNKGGLLITGLERGSPAEQAGLHGPNDVVIVGGAYQLQVGGDLIVAVDGQPVTTRDALQKVMDKKRGGDPLNLTIYRHGRTMDVKIKLDEAPAVL
ncbi:MAG TPA: trypsin-like peptidase domain-containing protein [Candidatus Sulfopaludibacter sp.]|jgi:putative serine protease PepD|nr:trypsin-like peptidase domain-containing protein [Candidatus Sulfopaludibacter sp.]